MATSYYDTEVRLGFTADINEARREMNQLQMQLEKLSVTPVSTKGFEKQITQANNEVLKLSTLLKDSFNVDTGKLDINRFITQMNQYGISLKDIKHTLASFGDEGQVALQQLNSQIVQGETGIVQMSNALTNFAKQMKRTMSIQLSYGVMNSFIDAFRSAYSYAQDLNESLTNIQIVTSKSTEDMRKFAVEANKAAKNLSTTTTAYTDAALIYYQQGLNDDEVRGRTDTTIKLANVTGQSAEEVSSYMTAVWNNFDDGSKKLEYYADVITALGAATASSSEEIAQGLSQFSAVADTVGLSYEYATSALATVVAQTRQSADTVGNAFKTIFARLESLNLGETLDDDTTLTKYTQALERVGVSVQLQNGQLKNMDTILEELGSKWETLNNQQKNGLAYTVAGARQYTNFIALMDNWDKVQRNIEIASGAEGTLQEQADIYAGSWEAANKRLKASWQELYDLVISDDFFIGLITGTSELVEGISSLIKSLGGLKGLLPTVIALTTQLFSKQITDGAVSLALNFESAKNAITGVDKKMQQRETARFSLIANNTDQTETGDLTAAKEGQIQFLQQFQEKQRTLNEVQKEYNFYLERRNQLLLEGAEKANAAYADELEILGRLNRTYQDIDDIQSKNADISILSNQLSNDKNLTVKDVRSSGVFSDQELENLGLTAEKANIKLSKLNITEKLLAETEVKLEDNLKTETELFNQKDALLAKHNKKVEESINLTKQEISETNDKINALKEEKVKLQEIANSKDPNVSNEDKIEAATKLKQVESELIDEEGTLAALQQDLAGKTNLANTAINNSANSINDLKNKAAEAANHVQQVVSVLTSAYAFYNASVQAVNDLADGNFKLSNIISILTTGLMTFNTINKLTNNELMVGVKAITGNIAVKSGLIAADKVLSKEELRVAAATGTLKLSLIEILWPIMAVVTAIGLLAGAYRLIEANSPEAKIEAAKQSADRAADTYSKLTNEINETNTALTELGNLYDKLSNLDEGSQEWLSTLQKINGEIFTLIDQYKDLDLISHLTKDENGAYGLDAKGLELINSSLRTKQIAAYNYSLEANQKVSNLEGAGYDSDSIANGIITYNSSLGNEGIGFHLSSAAKKDGAIGDYWADLPKLYGSIGDALFTEEGVKSLLNSDIFEFDDEEIKNAYGEIILEALNEQKDNIKNNYKASVKNNSLDDLKLQNSLGLLGVNRSTNDTKSLLGIESYSDITNSVYDNISSEFGQWNNHINYNENDKEWDKIQDFVKLVGADKYVAQRSGKMVVQIDDEEVEYSKDEVYQYLTELYSSDELQTRLKDTLSSTLSESLSGVDLSSLSFDKLNLIDNFKMGLENAAEGKDWNVDEIFGQFFNEGGNGSIDQFTEYVNKFNNLDFNNEQLVGQMSDWITKIQEGNMTTAEFTHELEKLNAQIEIDKMGEFFSTAAQGLGLKEEDAVKMQNYAKHLMTIAEESEDLDDSLSTDAQAAAELAVQVTRMDKGIDALADNYKNWNNILSKSSRESREYSEALSQIRQAVGDVLNVDGNTLSEKFLIDPENKQLLEDVAKGGKVAEEAIEKLQSKLDEEVIANIKIGKSDETIAEIQRVDDKFREVFDKFDGKNIEVGATIQDQAFLDAANELVETAGMTADEANAYFAGVGYEPVYSQEDLDTSTSVPNALTQVKATNIGWNPVDVDMGIFGHHSLSLPNVTLSTESIPLPPEKAPGDMPLVAFSGDGKPPKIKGMRKKATPTLSNYSSVNSGGRSPGSSKSSNNGGGGSGSKSSFKPKTKTIIDEKERYHLINNQLDDVRSKLDAVSTAKDRAFGKDKIDAIRKEMSVYEEYIDTQKRYLDEINNYLNSDKQSIITKYGAEFDQYGNILNYDKLVENAVNKYNELGSKEETAEQADKFWEEFEKDIKNYEESVKLAQDETKKLDEYIDELHDSLLEMSEYAFEFNVKINDSELKYVEYLMGKVDDKARDSAQSLALIGKQMDLNAKKIQMTQNNLADILSIGANAYTYDEEGNLTGIDRTIGENLLNQLISGEITYQQLSDQMNLTQNEMDKLIDGVDTLISDTKTLQDNWDAYIDTMNEFWDAWDEKFDKELNKYDRLNNITSNYKELIEIMGKDRLGITNETLKTLDKTVNEQYLQKTQGLYKQYIDKQAALTAMKAQNLDQSIIDNAQESLDELFESLQSAQAEAAQQFEDAYTNSIEIIFEEWEKGIAGSYKTMENLTDSFSRQKTVSDLYLDTYDQAYKISKLTRDINKSIDDTDNIKSKRELAKITETIQNKQKEGKKLSEDELGFYQKQYELLLARQALEDARNNKSQVRMTRDNEGNMSYVYTVDENEISKAEEKYSDVAHSFAESLQSVSEKNQEALVSLTQEYEEALRKAAEEHRELTDEEAAYFETRFANVKEQLDIVFDWNNYLSDLGTVTEGWDLENNFTDTLLSNVFGASSVDEILEKIQQTTNVLKESIKDAQKELDDYIDELRYEDGKDILLTYGGAEDLDSSLSMIEEETIAVTDSIQTLGEEFSNTVSEMVPMAKILQESIQGTMDGITDSTESATEALLGLFKVWQIDTNNAYGNKDVEFTTKSQSYTNNTYSYDGLYSTYNIQGLDQYIEDEIDNKNNYDIAIENIISEISKMINGNTPSVSLSDWYATASKLFNPVMNLEQEVTIHAEFPSVKDRNEIEEAFNNLVNRASQYANRKY